MSTYKNINTYGNNSRNFVDNSGQFLEISKKKSMTVPDISRKYLDISQIFLLGFSCSWCSLICPCMSLGVSSICPRFAWQKLRKSRPWSKLCVSYCRCNWLWILVRMIRPTSENADKHKTYSLLHVCTANYAQNWILVNLILVEMTLKTY